MPPLFFRWFVGKFVGDNQSRAETTPNNTVTLDWSGCCNMNPIKNLRSVIISAEVIRFVK